MKVVGALSRAAHRHPHADLVVAAVIFLVVLATGPRDEHAGAATILVAAVACGALGARHRHPMSALLVSVVAAEFYLAFLADRQGSLILAAPLLALYTVAESGSRRRALTAGALAEVAFACLHIGARPETLLGMDNLALAALGGLAVVAGDAARSRRDYLAAVEGRAHRAEQDRDAEAARQVMAERLRIARDLHDVVGHHLALINVQAGVAAHVLDSQPVEARAALGHIRQTSKTALGELGDTIGLLRQPGDPAVPTEPVLGLSGLPGLLTAFRRSGLVIDERYDGGVSRITVAAGLTTYRVVQEALTNVCKHAGPVRVTVVVRCTADALEVSVENGRPVAPVVPGTGGGHGLVGMRERVAALGGALSAGPYGDGGYRLVATLPLPGGES